jgi:hypothetical protein
MLDAAFVREIAWTYRNALDLLIQASVRHKIKVRINCLPPTMLAQSELLSFQVLDDSKNWWSVRNCRAETGFVPNSSLKKAS